ncbi:ABC transporter substrate-binding protein [Bradyrhizobium sp. WYCCWR 13023]|uniref:ABC transporter substrate-binding protein n=1 Tax=Bradyrhizobium zhengyangense TaxID=2911009 RepID=A0A9X1UJW5_9BRAD|nr:ABC transporter substrate-binding protein [Bradyrhizobium zhengyangense]MCG2632552.1 ABC transporter substrate-binding protein [Bradyrhizobium zhengyangense]
MKRRHFVTLVGGAALIWPTLSFGQQSARVWKIGYLGFGEASSWTSEVEAFRAGLRDLGYVEGRNLKIDFQWAERVDQTFDLAKQLVDRKVDVIFAPASTQVGPARRATATIPIVFAQHADPVGLGDVTSLSRPGGNITGMSMLLTEVSVKELEILKEILPAAIRVGLLWNPTTPSHPTAVRAVEGAAHTLGVELVPVSATTVPEVQDGFLTMVRDQCNGLLVLSSPLYTVQAELVAELQIRHRLPAIFANRINVKAGGLVSYGADLDDLYRRAAFYIDKIFRGATPADLPVEQASKYFMVLNLKTARALGVNVSSTLLARADEVIE